MASAAQTRAGQAYYELSLKDGALTKGLRAWSGKLRAFGAGIKSIGAKFIGIGAAIRAPFVAAEGIFAEMSTEMARMSQKSGIGVESLSQLAYAADKSGVSAESLGKDLAKMQKLIGQAKQGNSAAIDSLAKLGVSLTDLKGLSPEQQFELLADKIAKFHDPALRAAHAMEIFGKSGAEMLPLLNQGSAGIQNLMREADALGLTMSQADAEAGLRFGESLKTLWKQLKQVAFQIGSALAPTLEILLERSRKIIKGIIDWVKANKDLIIQAAGIGTACIAAGIGIYAIGTAVGFVAGILGGFATVLATAGTILGVVASAVTFLLTPLGLIAAAVAGLAGYFIYSFSQIGDSATTLGGTLGDMSQDVVEAFGAIRESLAAGNFKMAAQILWSTLKLEFNRGIAWLESKWIGFTGFFVDVWTRASYATAGIMTHVWAGLQIAWGETMNFCTNAGIALASTMIKTWFSAIGFIKKAWIRLKSFFDSDVDYDKEAARINAETEAQRLAVDQKSVAKYDQADQERDAKEAAIENERDRTLAALHRSQAAELARAEAARDDKQQAISADLSRLADEKNVLLHQAHEANKASPGDVLKNLGVGSAKGLADKLHANMDEASDGIKTSVTGTFSSAAAPRLLGSINPVLSEQRKTSRTLSDIFTAMKQFGVAAHQFGG